MSSTGPTEARPVSNLEVSDLPSERHLATSTKCSVVPAWRQEEHIAQYIATTSPLAKHIPFLA